MADTVTTNLQTSIDGWSAALAADSAAPRANYSLDGEQVSRQEWRESLLRQIQEAQQVINARNPFFIRTQAHVRGC